MSLKRVQSKPIVDKSSPEYAVSRYSTARSNLLLAIIFTVINIALELINAGYYLIFSISFPYYWFDRTDVMSIVIALAVLGLYVLCYFGAKRWTGWMVAALVLFIIDCLYLGFTAYIMIQYGISPASMALDFAAHVWVLYYLIVGAKYARRYREAMAQAEVDDPAALYDGVDRSVDSEFQNPDSRL